MTNRMSKLERKTNEAIATIFRMSSADKRLFGPVGIHQGRMLTFVGQRLQSAKKQNPGAVTADEVNLVASMNAERTEREGGGEEDSDDD